MTGKKANQQNQSGILPPTPTPNAHVVWLTGCHGMLGHQIAIELRHHKISFVKTDLEVDIADRDAVQSFVATHRPSWIVNCAAYTAVDRAETEPAQALRVNGDGPGVLGEIAEWSGVSVIHFSTDYVFDGKKETPYTERDEPNPLSVYGRTKLEGERRLAEATDRFFILRISWLYGRYGNNFVDTMLRLFRERDRVQVVHDQVGAPTWAGMLAANVARLISMGSDRYGTYHYQDRGAISWYDFATAILTEARERGLIHRDVVLEPVGSDQYPTAAVRPANSRMETGKVESELAFRIENWRENLKRYFDARGEGGA